MGVPTRVDRVRWGIWVLQDVTTLACDVSTGESQVLDERIEPFTESLPGGNRPSYALNSRPVERVGNRSIQHQTDNATNW